MVGRRAMVYGVVFMLVIISVSVATYELTSDSEGGSKISITYNSNGASLGSNSNISNTIKYDTTEVVSSQIKAPDVKKTSNVLYFDEWGWNSPLTTATFVGWATDAYGEVVYPCDSSGKISGDLVITGNITLYAIWSPFTVVIHQPTEYGSILYNASEYSKISIASGNEITLTFIPSGDAKVDYWMVDGEKVAYNENQCTLKITRNSEISVIMVGQNDTYFGLPVGFQAVEYVINTEGTTIDTGYYPNYTTQVKAQYTLSEEACTFHSAMFGARPSYDKNTYSFWTCIVSGSNGNMRSDYAGLGKSTFNGFYKAGSTVTLDKNRNVTTVTTSAGKSATETLAATEFYSFYTMYLFTIHGADMTGKSCKPIALYSFQIYDDGKIVRNFIPCYYTGESNVIKDSNGNWVAAGTVGLYDTVYGLFYTASTGTLTKGPDVYTMGFDSNGGTGGTAVFTYKDVSSLSGMVLTDLPTMEGSEGKSFYGYYVGKYGSYEGGENIRVFDENGRYVDGSLSIPGNYVFYAAWSPMIVKYYYDEGDPEPYRTVPQELGTTSIILAGPTKADYDFLCWVDSEGHSYNPGDSITFLKDTALTAVWLAKEQFSIVYHYNDGTGRTTTQTTTDTEITLSAAPVRYGHSFGYWTVSEDGTGVPLYPGDTYEISENIEFYAQWRYVILLDSSGGTGGSTSVAFTGTIIPDISVPTKSGAEFVGYVYSDGVMYIDCDGKPLMNWNLNTGTCLYAVWKYTVTLYLGSECSYGESGPGAGWVSNSDGTYSHVFQGMSTFEANMPYLNPVAAVNTVFIGWDCGTLHACTGSVITLSGSSTFSAKNLEVIYDASIRL